MGLGQRLGRRWGLVAAFWALAVPNGPVMACTSAAWSPRATAAGAPIIWKNRDTNGLLSRLVFVRDQPHSFIGLVDDDDPSGRMVYAGLNDRGFAIFNTVAYNLPRLEGEMHDLEGAIMAEALRTSTSVADFEAYLARNLGPNLGAQTNFVVTDARGEVWIYEVHNHGFSKFAAADAAEGRLVNTNFARSGAVGEGAGYLRHQRASELIRNHGPADLALVLNQLARDFGHPLLRVPTFEELLRLPRTPASWAISTDTIDREITAATVVIQGRRAAAPDAPATMWVMLGEPLTSLAVPVWVEAGELPRVLAEGTTAELLLESLRLRGRLRPQLSPELRKYVDLTALANREGMGMLPALREAQVAILARTDEFLRQRRSPSELARFQSQLADEAAATLRGLADRLGIGRAVDVKTVAKVRHARE